MCFDLMQELASFLQSQAANLMTAAQQEQAHLLLQEAVQGLDYGSPGSQAITLIHFAAVHRSQQQQQPNGQQPEQGQSEAAREYMPTTLEEVLQVGGRVQELRS